LKVNFNKFIIFALFFSAIDFIRPIQAQVDLSKLDMTQVNWNQIDWSRVDLAKLIGPDSKWVDQTPAPQLSYSQFGNYAKYAGQHLTEGEPFLFHESDRQSPLSYFPDWLTPEYVPGDENPQIIWHRDVYWAKLINQYRFEKRIMRYENIRLMHGINDKDLLNFLIPQEWLDIFTQFRQECIERDKLTSDKRSYAARFIMYDKIFKNSCAITRLAKMAKNNDQNALIALGFEHMDLKPKLEDIKPKAIQLDAGPSIDIPTIAVQTKPIGIATGIQTKIVESSPIAIQAEPIKSKPTTIQNAILEEKIVPEQAPIELKIQEVKKTDTQTVTEPAVTEPVKTETKAESVIPAIALEAQQEKPLKQKKSIKATTKPTFVIKEPTASDLEPVAPITVSTNVDTQSKAMPKFKSAPKKKIEQPTKKCQESAAPTEKKESVKQESAKQESAKQDKDKKDKDKKEQTPAVDSSKIASTKDMPLAAATKKTDKNLELWLFGKKALDENKIDDAVNFFEQIFRFGTKQKPQFTKEMFINFNKTIAQIRTHIDQRSVYALLIRIGLVMGFDSVGLDKTNMLKDFIEQSKNDNHPSVLFMLGYLFNKESELLTKVLKVGHGLHLDLSLIVLNKCLDQNKYEAYPDKSHIFDEACQLAESIMQEYKENIFEGIDLKISENILNTEQIKACYNIFNFLLKTHKLTEAMEWYICVEYSLEFILNNRYISKNAIKFWKELSTNIDQFIKSEIKTEKDPQIHTSLLACSVISSILRLPSNLSSTNQVEKNYDLFTKATNDAAEFIGNPLFAYAFFTYACYLSDYSPKTHLNGVLKEENKALILNLEERALRIYPKSKMISVRLGIDIIRFNVQNSQNYKAAKCEVLKAIELLKAASKSKDALFFLAKIYDPDFVFLSLNHTKHLINPNEQICLDYLKKAKELGSAEASLRLVYFYTLEKSADPKINNINEFEECIKMASTLINPYEKLAYNVIFYNRINMHNVVIDKLALSIDNPSTDNPATGNPATNQEEQFFMQTAIITGAKSALALKNVEKLKLFVDRYLMMKIGNSDYDPRTEKEFMQLLKDIRSLGRMEKNSEIALALLRIGQETEQILAAANSDLVTVDNFLSNITQFFPTDTSQ
jgi:hypothetical protein